MRAFLRQWNFCVSPVFPGYWWPLSTLSKRSSKSCFQSASNLLVWSSEHQPTGTKLILLLIAGLRAWRVVKHLIMNLKPVQNFSTSTNTLESCLKQFFIGNWELRNFSMIGYVRWQNSWDNAFRLFYTSLLSIPKRLACLSEAIKFFSYSDYLIIAGRFQPYQNGAPAVLLRKRHEHSRLILRAPTNSNAIALTPDYRVGRLIGAKYGSARSRPFMRRAALQSGVRTIPLILVDAPRIKRER